MNLIERFNILFYKNECIKVIITDTNKRVKTHIIRIKDKEIFSIGERAFIINYEAVFYSNSLPTYFYYIDNPLTISKIELKKALKPLDTEVASQYIEISSEMLHTAIDETIARKIIRYAEDGDKKIMSAIYMMGIVNVLATVGGLYFVYSTVDKVLQFLNEHEQIINAIRDALIGGVGN